MGVFLALREMRRALLRFGLLMASVGLLVGEALIGIADPLVVVAPFFVMCDTQDIGKLAGRGPSRPADGRR